jgi:hypothetical protein
MRRAIPVLLRLTRLKPCATIAALACAAVLLCAGRSFAQTVNASLVGSIHDPHGAPVARAAVTVSNEDTGLVRATTTTEGGAFALTHLPPGRYRVVVTAPGFSSFVDTALALETDQVRRLAVALQLQPVRQNVTVVAPLPRVNTDTAAKGDVIAGQLLFALPLNGRNYADLAALVPGAYHRVDPSEQGEGFSASGARGDSANFTLDGIVNRSDRNGIAGVALSLDSVREFDVQTSTYTAEAGRSGGAQVTVVSKSGANRLGGSLFDYLRHDAFDARNPFMPPGDAPVLRRQQGGAAGGGPIRRDRAFFFASYERLRERRSQAANTTAPNVAWLQGDFRNVRGAGPDLMWGNADDTNRIVDPLTRKEFAIPNVIPQSRFDPVARQILAFIPPANLPGALDGYGAAGVARTDRQTSLGRADLLWRPGATVSVRWAREWGDGDDPFPAARNYYPGFGRTSTRRLDSAAVVATTPIAGSWLNETRAGYFGHRETTAGQNSATDYVSQFALTGLTTSDPALWGFPSVRIDGFAEFGDRPNDPSRFTMQDFQIASVVSRAGASHTVKAGVDLVRSVYSELDIRNVRGDFRFRGRSTNPAGQASSGFRAFADFLLGFVDQTQRQIGAQPADLRGWQTSLFAQDDWRVASALTLTLGVRYERQTPLVEAANRLANFVPALGEVVLAGDPRLPRGLLTIANDNLAPRLGFAWRPAHGTRTVIRGGAGVYYSLEAFNVTRQQLAVSFPFVRREQFSRLGNDPRSLTFANPFPSDRAAVQGIDQPLGMATDYRRPEYYQYNLTFERQVGGELAVEVGYVGSQGRHLGRRYNLNQPVPAGLLADGTLATIRPFPAFGDIQFQDQANSSSYNALQASARRRLAGGLTLLAAYTLSRTTDTGSISTGNLTNVSTSGAQKAPQDIYNMAAERGLSDFHRAHQFSAAFVWDLPIGPGRRWLSASAWPAGALAGGWQLSGLVVALSGRPFTPQYAAGDFATERPDLVSDPYANVPPGLWFNPNAFARPVAAANDPSPYGNAGRNILIGPGYRNVDLALTRTFRLRGNAVLQVRAETFNALNTVNYQLPVFLLDRTDVGRVTATANDAREWQFALRVMF